jgi:hypothetical protein
MKKKKNLIAAGLLVAGITVLVAARTTMDSEAANLGSLAIWAVCAVGASRAVKPRL